jgi:hypothetical protein
MNHEDAQSLPWAAADRGRLEEHEGIKKFHEEREEFSYQKP